MRRFYHDSASVPVPGGFGLLLDGKPVQTPARRPLVVPTARLAAAIADEWAAQGDTLDLARMYLTQFANTAIDRVGPLRDDIVRATVRYAETDLLCHRAASPAALAERQHRLWQPLIDWAAHTFDAPLIVTNSLIAADQPRQALDAITAAVAALDDFRLTGLQVATGLLGSVVLALALSRGRIAAAQAFAAAQLDEDFQAERWGVDDMAAARAQAMADELASVQRLFDLLNDRG